MVAAEDDTLFARGAAPQHERRIGTHSIEINSGVTGSGESSVVAIRLF
jgi:hypothetical protein